jgi:hypothetical protein
MRTKVQDKRKETGEDSTFQAALAKPPLSDAKGFHPCVNAS